MLHPEDMIRPVVEFAEIDKDEDLWKIFDESLYPDQSYWSNIIARLKKANGVYVFFDSRGVAIYIGKAKTKKQTLWVRSNQSYAEDRSSARGIILANHPSKAVKYKDKTHGTIRFSEQKWPLYEVAHYFSAYEVEKKMIDRVEALLIRTHCNTLLNLQRGARSAFGTINASAETTEK